MAAFVFSIFGAQPLVISGVTGESIRMLCSIGILMDHGIKTSCLAASYIHSSQVPSPSSTKSSTTSSRPEQTHQTTFTSSGRLIVLLPIISLLTIYQINSTTDGRLRFGFGPRWTYFWAAIMHWVFAAFGGCNVLKYVTRMCLFYASFRTDDRPSSAHDCRCYSDWACYTGFSCETFGFYVAWVYLQYGCVTLSHIHRAFQTSPV